MQFILTKSWPILLGMLLIMLGQGLQSTLLGLRANAEGFSVNATGMIMSLYYVGFILGSFLLPKMISGVGHIRVFTAMASLSSITILVHGVFVNEFVWAAVRIITGFAYAGLYIATESWLNDSATNQTRGKIFAAYLMIINIGLFAGQYLIQLAPIENIDLFVMTSVLVSIAVVPISLSKRPAPELQIAEPFPLKKLIDISPLGAMGIFSSGIVGGTFFTIGAVVTAQMGFTISQSATFIAAYVLGGAFIPPLCGVLSDKLGRRPIIILCSFMAAIAVMCGSFANIEMMYVVSFMSGGFIVSLYGLCVAYMNDHLEPTQFVSASASMILVNALGAAMGPVISTFLMGTLGPRSFFIFLAIVLFAVTIFTIYRSSQTDALPVEEQGEFVPIRQNTTATIISVTTDHTSEEESKTNKE